MVKSCPWLKEWNLMKAKIAIVGSGNIGWALKQLLKSDFELRQGEIADGFDA